ncbi:nuclear transport factor 2 family protein [Streptomyces sp. SID9727]|uniref:nuclear transport factor 2 family protein n=1 Tax=Streptomyces sp. SID9727 TaxID=2706114 RepID=UPI0013C952DD|nr:nuclear transport factor 2 family protein [Streptomyces sp. SID9727]NEC67134.1 nuclear transport factor 2 family protein [Streptomyces sp. SID9727]
MHTDAWTSSAPYAGGDLVTAAGADHVRLVYEYLDAGDLDGCASLLHDRIALDLPGAPTAHGRIAFLHAHRDHLGPPARHVIDHVVAHARNVVAAGRRFGPGADDACVRFVDFFRIAEDGMVESCVRYYHALP